MLTSILNTVLTTAAANVAGGMTKLRVSKTKVAAHAGVGAGFYALLPMAIAGDNEAIGALMVMAASWAWSLFDRWRKDRV